MNSLKLLAATLALAASACANGQQPSSFVESSVRPDYVTTTFTYASRSGQELKLDRVVDKSVKVKGKRPVIIFMYGGGWESGSRTDAGIVSGYKYFASLGYTILAIDYRLGVKIAKDRKEVTSANWPDVLLRSIEWSVEDLFDATAFALKHAAEWDIDPAQIVLLGGSAGATNSLVAEYNVANETRLAQSRLPANFRYAGVISMAGAFWLKPGTPLTFKNKPAPIMFFHGSKDQLVTYDEVQAPFAGYGPVAYFKKFPDAEHSKWFVDYPEGDHVIAGTPLLDQKLEMQSFLQKLVRERQELSIHTVERSKTPKNIESFSKALKGG